MTDMGMATTATRPKCHAANGAVTSHTAMHSTHSPREAIRSASPMLNGGRDEVPYHRSANIGAT